MENKNRIYFIVLLTVLGLGFTYFMAANVVPKMFVSLTKAAPATTISMVDSRVLGVKILAKADGVDRNLINVYLMDNTLKGVAGKDVMLEGLPGIEIIKNRTGNDGKASFSVTSTTEGTFELKASTGGIPLPKTIKVTFRN